MRRLLLSVTVITLFAFLGGAAGLAAPQEASTPQEPATSAKASTAKPHHHAHHRAKAAGVNYTAKYASGIQSLSGTLTAVDAGQKILVVTDSDGTPFNFKVGRGTKIEVNGQKGTLDSLSAQTNQQVSVKFRDRLNAGLVAQSVDIGG